MKKNLGSTDRTIRTVAAIAIGVLLLIGQITGVATIVVGILAVVFLSTSMVNFCPLYVPFKISTYKEGTTQAN